MSFKEGDSVTLKSGGPVMTISELKENDRCVCRWFDKNTQFKDIFNSSDLKEYEEPNRDWVKPTVLGGRARR